MSKEQILRHGRVVSHLSSEGCSILGEDLAAPSLLLAPGPQQPAPDRSGHSWPSTARSRLTTKKFERSCHDATRHGETSVESAFAWVHKNAACRW